ncbi:MAG: leucine-rich repeat protein [Paludibacteraceae bacterium]|nr:leucine-rich repeat protein [Paludibacteraceae bacterium]
MRKIILTIVWVLELSECYAYDFKATIRDNIELCFNIHGENVAYITNECDDSLNYHTLKCDTLFLPEKVTDGINTYSVNGIESDAFIFMKCRCALYIPKSIIEMRSYSYPHGNPMLQTKFTEYIVDNENPVYKSFNGVLYSKSMKVLLSYPPQKADNEIILPEGIDTLGKYAFFEAEHLKSIEFPLSLKVIKQTSLAAADSIETIILQDSISYIESTAIDCKALKKIVLGTCLQKIHPLFLYSENPIDITCRANIPPELKVMRDFECINMSSTLHVPRHSLNLYRNADGWKKFENIIAIEPPIVTGVNQAEISWVQNFSATEYVWTLYLDQELTLQFMTLIFDDMGRLVKIDISDYSASHDIQSAIKNLKESTGEISHYVDYYSFTITGLNENTDYFYTVKAYAGTEVIDTDSGSFTTQKATALQNIKTGTSGIQKIIRNGQLFIIDHDRKLMFDTAGKQYPYEINK